MADTFVGLVYLYNGGNQPEIHSVTSEDEVLVRAEGFHFARLEIPGQPPIRFRVKKKPQPSLESSWDAPYDWKRARNHLQGDGDPSSPFDSFDHTTDKEIIPR